MARRLGDLTTGLADAAKFFGKLQVVFKEHYSYGVLTPETFDQFVDDILACLPRRTDRRSVRDSVIHLLNQELKPNVLELLAFRLSGNAQHLRSRAVLPWAGQPATERAFFQVVSVTVLPIREGKKEAVRLDLVAITGYGAGLKCSRVFTSAFLRYAGSSVFGFTPPRGGLPISSPIELAGLRFEATVTPQECQRRGEFTFDKFKMAGSVKNYNRRVIKGRRRQFEACPKKKQHDCLQCPLTRDDCPRALLPRKDKTT